MRGISTGRLAAGAAVLIAAAGCRFDPPGGGGTNDAASPDGRPPSDATIDAEPGTPDAGPVRLTFGERPGADQTGVTADTWLDSINPTVNHGQEPTLRPDANPVATGLIEFDLTALPGGATVIAAELEVVTTTDPLEAGMLQAYAVLENWAQPAATWIDRTNAAIWTNPGASPPLSRSAALAGEVAPRETFTAYVIALDVTVVQGWVDLPGTNHGLALISTSPASNGVELSSSESTVEGARPVLRVTYRP